MPIYAFACADCGHAFERLQKLSDPDPEYCPACSKGAVRRQLTAPQFRLAGSGWYETDFKKDGEIKRNLVEKGDGVPAATPDAPAATSAKAAPAPSATAKAEAIGNGV